jgi:hypothetical protein
MVDLASTGALIEGGNFLRINSSGTNATNSYCMEILQSGNLAGSSSGFALRIVGSGTESATSYAAYIDAGANEALHVDAGKVLVDETLEATGGIITVNVEDDIGDPPTQQNMDDAFGAGAAGNDGMIGIINDAGAGANAWLCVNTDGAWYYAAKLTIGA